MKKNEIIDTLKAQYNRDLRKQLVKSILDAEVSKDSSLITQKYKLINQIFSYVISELGWTMAENTKNWDSTPLDIMSDVFPKIKKSQWYKEQQISVDQNIGVMMDNPE
jgi:DNA-binding ferritin-like protein